MKRMCKLGVIASIFTYTCENSLCGVRNGMLNLTLQRIELEVVARPSKLREYGISPLRALESLTDLLEALHQGSSAG